MLTHVYIRGLGAKQLFSFTLDLWTNGPKIQKTIEEDLKLQTPTWGNGAKKEDLKATWLGHACFLVELPAPEGAKRGPRILYDPVFSHRCSPFTFMGPGRYTSERICVQTDSEYRLILEHRVTSSSE